MKANVFRILKHDLLIFGLLVAGAGCLGVGVNQLRSNPLPLTYIPKGERLRLALSHLGAPEIKAGESDASISQISLEEFRELLRSHAPVVVDARPEAFYRLGHVQGALALPRENFDAHYERHRGTLDQAKARPLVIYCQGDPCEDSGLVAQALARLGHQRLSLFVGGWSEWEKAGLPIER